MVRDRLHPESQIPFGRVLYELTAGHPGAALDILDLIPAKKLSFSALLSATRQAALEGQMSQVLIQLWSQLPTDSKSILRELIFQRRIRAITFTPELERLHLAGIIHKKQIGKQGYIDFCSWYAELLVHLHAGRLGFSDIDSSKVDMDEFMPRTSTICVEAFRVINEIETLARNYISVQLGLRTEPGFHYLMGRARKYNPESKIEEDAFQRAEDWQNRSADRGLPAELNPLIAYLSTRDLANLIEELGAKLHLPEWLRIAQAIRTLSDVRDAVMHNQLIDDSELERLYELQADIYNALSKQSS